MLTALLLAASVQVGLDRVAGGETARLAGKRIGYVVHAASVTADGHHGIDVLRSVGIRVERLFTPEHGLRSRAAAGEMVGSGRDEQTGLPVVSLYGERKAPRAEDLDGLDALVFDLQDAGVRFYTYASTMILCLEAAAAAGVEFVVLDRPDPLGGERVEGPLSDPPEVVARSMVNMTPGPLVHGLTLAELARYVNDRLAKPARLTVVPMSGWRRTMTWQDTGRAWPSPSPNLRTAEAALAYPGTCLLEATNASEGRGSQAPFLLLGAPWLRPEALIAAVRVPGFSLEAVRFTPRASAAALRPKFVDVGISGVRVRVSDAAATEPFALGVALLRALRASHPELTWRNGDGASLDRLVGTRRLREALERGDSAADILESDAAAHARWREERRSVLLY